MKRAASTPRDIRQACLEEAQTIIHEQGVEALSMREVARRLGVSHQAPYKHFASREHILAEIVADAYRSFGDWLIAQSDGADVDDEMRRMGLAYFDYAARHPLQYRLMFSTPLPDPGEHPRMMAEATRAFVLLRDLLARKPVVAASSDPALAAELDALFVWSAIHGLTSVLHSDVIKTARISRAAISRSIEHLLQRIGVALSDGAPSASPAAPAGKLRKSAR